MNLPVKAALRRFEQAAEESGYEMFRSSFKVNVAGELALVVLVPPRREEPGQWTTPWLNARENPKRRR